MFRVLKSGGHFSISDIVIDGKLPEKVKKSAEAYIGCVAGAMQKKDQIELVDKVGFKNLEIKSETPIELPDSALLEFLDYDSVWDYK